MTRQSYTDSTGRVFPYFPVENPTRYIARFFSYLTVQEREFETELDALRFLIHGEERGDHSSEGVYAPDGSQVLDKDAVRDAWANWDYEADAPILEGTSVDVTHQRRLRG